MCTQEYCARGLHAGGPSKWSRFLFRLAPGAPVLKYPSSESSLILCIHLSHEFFTFSLIQPIQQHFILLPCLRDHISSTTRWGPSARLLLFVSTRSHNRRDFNAIFVCVHFNRIRKISSLTVRKSRQARVHFRRWICER